MLQHSPIEVTAAKVAVEGGRQHSHLALGEGDDAGLGGAVAHVEEEDVLGRRGVVRQLQRLGQTPAESSCSSLVHEAKDIQPSDGGCVQDSSSLSISEPAWH
mmetsp:Transcript_934/g.2957  ORF Transcript_934/g.2957 Transcript_934/m.2957 type:complete len:102 (+) Transcript_934:1965-2270(+)